MKSKRLLDEKIFKKAEWAHIINYGALFSFLGLFAVLEISAGETFRPDFFAYYVNAFFNPAKSSLFWFPAAILVYLLFRFIISFTVGAINSRPPTWKDIILGRGGVKAIVQALKSFMTFGVPAILALFSLTLVFGHVNALNAAGLKDELVASWDKALTGAYPFLALGSIHYPAWFFNAVSFSFGALPTFLLLFGIYLAHEHRETFKEFTAAFSLALLIMLPVWLKLPALSPQDRFIDNVYKLPVPAEVDAALRNYRPQKELREFFAAIREKKEGLGGTMPTSTIPSAHVAWATLLIIYAWRAAKKIGLIFLPIAALSTFGAVLFAQHYFVDIPAGVAAAAAAAFAARVLTAHKSSRSRPTA